MTNSDYLNTLVLAVVLAAVAGMGAFLTQKKQPETLERLEQEETALRLRQAEIAELLVEQASSREQAEYAVRRWNSRYKVLPTMLTSPAVVQYLNTLSSSGFKSFDVTLGGVVRRDGFSTLSYDIRGVGHFEALYRFIWEVENGRGLYRVSDLTTREIVENVPNPETEVPYRLQLVEFSMTLEAYFGGADGMSAPDSIVTVPDHVLPARAPADNPFYPLVLEQLPPNSDNLVDVEVDALVSVVGGVAVFRGALGPRPVQQGDRVYLGRLTEVDPNRARVVAELNKGGIRERVEIELATGERYRQALGRVQIVPLSAPPPARPSPPQPGTPEYLRLYPESMPAGLESDVEQEEAPNAQAAVTQPDRGVAVRPFPGPRPAPTDVPQD